MTDDFYGKRIEEVIDAAWKGGEERRCLWWQDEWWSWRRLDVLARDCEKKLREAGLKKGERIVLLLPNSPIVLALTLACWRIGGTLAPLNGMLSPVNLIKTIQILDASAVFILNGRLPNADEVEKKVGVPINFTGTDEPLKSVRVRDAVCDNGDMAVIFSTSGTSGAPKAVPCSHTNILADMADVPYAAPGIVRPDAVFLNVLPNFHAFGSNDSGYLPLIFGFAQTIVPNFVPVKRTIDAIINSGVDTIIAVPTILSFLTGALAKMDKKIGGIKFIISGGDRLDLKLDALCVKYLGTGVLEGYGLTECSPVVAFSKSMEERKPGTVGVKFRHLECEIHDRQGNKIGLHDEGVLWLRGPAVVKSYFNEVNTKERFRDGWFNTGDVVRIDSDGYIKIVDRATDIIIVGGFNVYPQEVEAVLREHPAVQQAVVVGEPNSMTGEVVKAFIILKSGARATPKDIIDFCKERLGHYKVPRLVAFVDSYPLSPAGKILRRELRKVRIENKI